MDGPSQGGSDNTVIRNAAEARTAVASQKAPGYDFIKVYTNLPVEAYRAVPDTSKRKGTITTAG